MKRLAWMALSLLLILLVGCGNSNKDFGVIKGNEATRDGASTYPIEQGYAKDEALSYDYATTPSEEVGIAEDNYSDSSINETESSDNVAEGRKLIRNTSLTVETYDYEVSYAYVVDRVKELKGYMESVQASTREDSDRWANMVIRIPADKLDAFLVSINKENNVVSRYETVEDVTLQYVDVESKKKALREEYSRLEELLAQADSLESIIALQSRMSEVRYEIEASESRLRTYDNLVDYATVTIDIYEVERYSPPANQGIWDRIVSGSIDSWSDFGNGIIDIGIGLIVGLPYILTVILIIIVFVIIFRVIVKNNKKKERIRVAGYQQMVDVNKTSDISINNCNNIANHKSAPEPVDSTNERNSEN